MSEVKRIAIVDKDGNDVLLSVRPTQEDPTKNAIVVCNRDGSPIGKFWASFGVVSLPTLTKNPDGTITVGADGVVIFNTSNTGNGRYKQINCTTGTTLTIPDNSVSYIYVSYNSGNPVYSYTTSPSTFLTNYNFVPIVRAVREGTTLHFEEYDEYGVQLPNKMLYKDVAVNSFQRQTGLVLSTTPTRKSSVSGGFIWFGVESFNVDTNTAGSAGTMYEYYPVAGVWNKALVTEYDATYYSDGTDRQTLGPSKRVSKYFYRDAGDDNEVYYTHGNFYNSQSDALAEAVPTAPTIMTAHSIYVGKIVIQSGSTNGTAYPRAWEGAITTGGVSYNDLITQTQIIDSNAFFYAIAFG